MSVPERTSNVRAAEAELRDFEGRIYKILPYEYPDYLVFHRGQKDRLWYNKYSAIDFWIFKADDEYPNIDSVKTERDFEKVINPDRPLNKEYPPIFVEVKSRLDNKKGYDKIAKYWDGPYILFLKKQYGSNPKHYIDTWANQTYEVYPRMFFPLIKWTGNKNDKYGFKLMRELYPNCEQYIIYEVREGIALYKVAPNDKIFTDPLDTSTEPTPGGGEETTILLDYPKLSTFNEDGGAKLGAYFTGYTPNRRILDDWGSPPSDKTTKLKAVRELNKDIESKRGEMKGYKQNLMAGRFASFNPLDVKPIRDTPAEEMESMIFRALQKRVGAKKTMKRLSHKVSKEDVVRSDKAEKIKKAAEENIDIE